MTTIAVYNIKGGVGKSATAVNLSYLAADEGAQTLICDLDPQSSASFYFRVKPKIKAGVNKILKNEKQALKSIKGTDFENLDLLPADFSFRNLDLKLDAMKRSRKRIKDMTGFFGDYEFVFFDCPPNITLVSENVFFAADFILTPIIPTTLSLRTFEQLLAFFKNNKIRRTKIIPFFSMVESRKKMHRELMEKMSKEYKGILKNYIPYLSDIEKMGIYRKPVMQYRGNSRAAAAYRELWKELHKRINK